MNIYKVYYACPHKSKLKLNESILLSLAILTSEGVDPLYSKWMTTFYLKEIEYLTKNIQKLPQSRSHFIFLAYSMFHTGLMLKVYLF